MPTACTCHANWFDFYLCARRGLPHERFGGADRCPVGATRRCAGGSRLRQRRLCRFHRVATQQWQLVLQPWRSMGSAHGRAGKRRRLRRRHARSDPDTARDDVDRVVAGRQLAEGFSSGIRTFQDGVSPYPMGNLRSSALDLARFMIMYTSDGRVFGNEVLAPGTVAFALSPQASGGVFWGPWNAARYRSDHARRLRDRHERTVCNRPAATRRDRRRGVPNLGAFSLAR